MQQKGFFICAMLCSVLTFFGVGYVFYSNGAANAGFAILPMLGTMLFLRLYRGK